MNDTSTDHWSQFWQQGHITTFGAALENNYEGVIHDFWMQQYQAVPVAAAVVDVATGNGALALLAADFAERHQLSWTVQGCDLARVEEKLSTADKLRSSITFHSGVACETLPFADTSFDLVSSQFGFEYGDRNAGVAEFFRVLKPGGTFAAICHHQDSYTLAASREELAVYRLALDEYRIFASAIDYIEAKSSAPGSLEEKKQALNLAINSLRQRHGEQPCCKQLVGALSQAIKGSANRPAGAVIEQLQHADQDFKGGFHRLQDLVKAALTVEDIAALADHCRSLGFCAIETGTLEHTPGEIAGHTFVARR